MLARCEFRCWPAVDANVGPTRQNGALSIWPTLATNIVPMLKPTSCQQSMSRDQAAEWDSCEELAI